jgi:hypothetical protein
MNKLTVGRLYRSAFCTGIRYYATFTTHAAPGVVLGQFKMRVKICVRRNGLPDANLVWPVVEEETGNKLTVARLLSQVDEAIPLESVDWALEDYIVEIGGFECLHFQYLSDILKEGDQVT